MFSISLSVLSLANKLWRYGYWTLYQCLPVRNVPTELSLYNYKLSGVTDGNLSFAASSMHRDEAFEIELSEKATQEVIAPLNEIRVVVSNTEGLMSGGAGTVHEEPADDQGHSGSDAASVSRLNARIRQLEEQNKKEKQQLEDEKNRRIQLEEEIKRLQLRLAQSGPSQSHSS